MRLEPWGDEDAAWYAETVRDPEIQRFTTDSPTLDAAQVQAAINRLRSADNEEGFLIRDAASGAPLGNIALAHNGQAGEVSYWLAPEARGQGAATRALVLFTAWIFKNTTLTELRLRAHQDNVASQKVALRAGYRRDPQRDGRQEVKGHGVANARLRVGPARTGLTQRVCILQLVAVSGEQHLHHGQSRTRGIPNRSVDRQ
ncbi:GNAT family N-acetyltransferase [Streptosporangium brasiliense]|uniref:GNAT family N-acetyltransferase n=1 Tax=Streptosporangium brasiliense TaxID=47480 RepID=UPI003522E102